MAHPTFRQVYEAYETVVDAVTDFAPAKEPISPVNSPSGRADKTFSIEMELTPLTERGREVTRCRASVTLRWLRKVNPHDQTTTKKECWTDAHTVYQAVMDRTESNFASLSNYFLGTQVTHPAANREWLLVTQLYASDFYASIT